MLREILHDWSDADCLRILREVSTVQRGCEGVLWQVQRASLSAGRVSDLFGRKVATPAIFSHSNLNRRLHPQVRAAVGDRSGCRLLLVEACISEQMASSASARINGDIHMLVQYGDAQERTEAQFNALLAASGFQLQRVVPTKGLFFVLEATTA